MFGIEKNREDFGLSKLRGGILHSGRWIMDSDNAFIQKHSDGLSFFGFLAATTLLIQGLAL